MKRVLLILLLVIALAIWLGVLIDRDPGYVLVSYDGATLQTGLWVMLVIVAVAAVSIYYLTRLLFSTLGIVQRVRAWQDNRKLSKGVTHTSRGMMYLLEGNLDRAARFLLSGARLNQHAAINYINLARIANQQGDATAVQSNLRLALEADPSSKQAVHVVAAELAADRADWGACLEHLSHCPVNNRVLRLKKDALAKLQDWDGLAEFLPDLESMLGKEELVLLEKVVVLNRLAASDLDDATRLHVLRKASEVVRDDAQVLQVFCEQSTDEKEKESRLRKAIKKQWQPLLVETYAGLGNDTLAKRLKTAKGWEKAHAEEPSLYYCLGELYEASGMREEARTAFERCLELGKHARASRQLANLLAFEGDFERSNEYLRAALETRVDQPLGA